MTFYSTIKPTIAEISGDLDILAPVTHYLQSVGTVDEAHYRQLAGEIPEHIPELLDPGNLEWDIPFPPTTNPIFTFIDLFAGIGGFRIAFQDLGGKCVFSSEWDKQSRITYEANFGEYPFGDINQIRTRDIPDHDVLLAGFPCQAFSIAGRKEGFDDTRGTLFFEIARILKDKRPKAFFLENVKGLSHHHGGKTLSRILQVLREELGYHVPEPRVINAKDFGVPQNRERVFIVGFLDEAIANDFEYPIPIGKQVKFADVKEDGPVSIRYYLSERYLCGLKKHRQRHESKGNGFGYIVIEDEAIANSIVLGGMGRERNLVLDCVLSEVAPVTNIRGPVNKEGIRRMTPREWARLQGFPDTFKIDAVAHVHSYRQMANSVAVPAIRETGKMILRRLMS